MIWCRPIRDRRGVHRPSNGDRAVCPRCGDHSLEFNDRYRLAGPNGVIVSTPAWVCDHTGCGCSLPVRAASTRHLTRPQRNMARASLGQQLRKKSS
jgi:hypothetical protein